MTFVSLATRVREAYRKYIQERFTADKVTKVLKGICNIIEANVLAVSDQDYEPWEQAL